MISASYVIHLRPPLTLRNSLPIPIRISVLGSSFNKGKTLLRFKREKQFKNTCFSILEKVVTDTSLFDASYTTSGNDYLDFGEKLVNPGDTLHLPTVKTSAKLKDVQTYIVVKVINFFELSLRSNNFNECFFLTAKPIFRKGLVLYNRNLRQPTRI